MEQIYSFNTIRYKCYDAFNNDSMSAYKEAMTAIIEEGYIPVNQVSEILEQRKRHENTLNTNGKEDDELER